MSEMAEIMAPHVNYVHKDPGCFTQHLEDAAQWHAQETQAL